MREIHYRNIGFPKTGTTWLWRQLMSHPEVGKIPFVYKEAKPNTLQKYISLYEHLDISVNLDTRIFQGANFNGPEYGTPKQIHNHTTHLSMTLRSPYDILNSMYNMERNRNPNFIDKSSEFTDFTGHAVHSYSNIKRIFDEWKHCKLPVRYALYDDLVTDPKKFFEDICDYIGIAPIYDTRIKVVFKTEINKPLVFENTDVIDYINNQISFVEEYFKRDLSHWKK